MSRRTALIALLAAVALAGCLGGTPAGTSDGAEQLQNESLAAMADVETYTLRSDIEMRASGQTVEMDVRGAINRSAKRARVLVDVSGPQAISTKTIIANRTAYVQAGEHWQTRPVPQNDIWEQNSRLAQQRELFRASTIEITGSTEIDGVPVTVVDIQVPESELDNLTSLAQQGAGGQATITDADYTAYISNETSLLRRTEVDLTMGVDGQSINGTVTMTFDDFDEPLEIRVPPAATDAAAAIEAPA
jgi:hypothetical protein